jgi:murein DD-endopeptidase / murein LD-carboxypeptidase
MRTFFNVPVLFCLLLFVTSSCKQKQKESELAKKKANNEKEIVKQKKVNEFQSHGSEEAFNVLQQKLGISSREIKNSKLYSFISEWYGVPYKYSGCHKSGVDCSCFAGILYETVYGKKTSRTASEIFSECEKINPDEAKEGDLIFFKINGNSISHVGIYLKNRCFVHSSTSKGVVINSIEEAYYKKYIFCAGKLKRL